MTQSARRWNPATQAIRIHCTIIMAKIKSPVYLLGSLAGSLLAALLAIHQHYHPNAINRGLLDYGCFSPQVEMARTTDLPVSVGTAGTGTVAYVRSGDPMTADFVRPTKDFFIRFEIDPPDKVINQSNPGNPRSELLANFSVQSEQAKIYTRPKILEGRYIDINLSGQILSIFEDGKLLDSYLVSTGKKGMETPRGTHAIISKCSRVWSKKYGLFMAYWMAITPRGSFGIHELPESPGGYKEGANDLGIPVSHGCIRLGIGPAARVYNWAEIGTPVVVY